MINIKREKSFSRNRDELYKKDLDILYQYNVGQTPLQQSKVYKNVYIKNEGLNPSGSYKDRESIFALKKAQKLGYNKISIASSGNAAVSAAFFSKFFNLKLECYTPKSISNSKNKLIQFFGAEIKFSGKDYEECYQHLKNLKNEKVFNISPGILKDRNKGGETIAYEIYEQLGFRSPAVVICPVGNGSALASIYNGFRKLAEDGRISNVPQMCSVQIKGMDPINSEFRGKKIPSDTHVTSECEAIAARISFCSEEAIHALKESKGIVLSVSDRQVVNGLKYSITKEGIMPELSSASVFAGLDKLIDQNDFGNQVVVLINTATGLKDIKA